jgi:hypothetical protein
MAEESETEPWFSGDDALGINKQENMQQDMDLLAQWDQEQRWTYQLPKDQEWEQISRPLLREMHRQLHSLY